MLYIAYEFPCSSTSLPLKQLLQQLFFLYCISTVSILSHIKVYLNLPIVIYALAYCTYFVFRIFLAYSSLLGLAGVGVKNGQFNGCCTTENYMPRPCIHISTWRNLWDSLAAIRIAPSDPQLVFALFSEQVIIFNVLCA